MSFGMHPRVNARMLVVDARRSITARFVAALDAVGASNNGGSAFDERSPSNEASPGHTSSETSTCSQGDAKRRRNADNVHDRDSIVHLRKVRNRVSAARTNEARKRRIAANKAELEELKNNRVPKLKLRLDELRFENKRLKELVEQSERSSQHQLPDEIIDPEGAIPLTGGKSPMPQVLFPAADLVFAGPLATSPMLDYDDLF